ncbi:MAG: SpoIIE family protein phosphatase [Acidimicrobiia bacterium]|nr:SpoIIE family protein phosphatase [Acidimicrobiia bacterium]
MAGFPTADRMLAVCDMLADSGGHLDPEAVAAAAAEQLARLTRCDLAVTALRGPDGLVVGSYPRAAPDWLPGAMVNLYQDGLTQPFDLFGPAVDSRVAGFDGGSHHGVVAAIGPIEGGFSALDDWLVMVAARRMQAQLELVELHRWRLADADVVRDAVLAGEVQQALMAEPHHRIGSVDLSASFRPARHLGGDLYDVFSVDRQAVALVADVSGKGAPAALLSTAVHAAGRHAFSVAGPNPARIIAQISAEIETLLEHTGRIVTVAVAATDPNTGTIRIASAGHSPVIVRQAGHVRLIKPLSPPLGLCSPDEDEIELSVHRGDLLLLGSDGLIDQRRHDGTAYGVDHLLSAVRELPVAPAHELLRSLFGNLDAFAAGAVQDDDQTGLLISVQEDRR